ncbi:MAG: hypothetical protein AMXMBFR75_12210 [Candidatus Hinthialibacteria bacterium]|nr:MAG: hypothetical protein UZ16_OP3001003318 [Candidatus Hinthialibacteria bacterium OLB16]MCK6495076.1 hypothetical protein [bacterium]NUP92990.1 hypothetical protein [Candidatus Omnitrophota bacterium]
MNFWSRFVFGFILAQVIPGVLCTFFLFFISVGGKIISTSKVMGFTDYLAIYAERIARVPVWLGSFFVGAVCFGIVLHWFNWMVLARLEQQAESNKQGGLENLPWHKRPPIIQVFLWPVDLLREWWILFFQTPNFESIIRRENLIRVPPEKFTQLSWIEDFYLPFAQFLCNLNIALIPVLVSVIVVFNFAGFTIRRGLFLLMVYAMIGLTRVLARQQLISLVRAERDLIEEKKKVAK